MAHRDVVKGDVHMKTIDRIRYWDVRMSDDSQVLIIPVSEYVSRGNYNYCFGKLVFYKDYDNKIYMRDRNGNWYIVCTRANPHLTTDDLYPRFGYRYNCLVDKKRHVVMAVLCEEPYWAVERKLIDLFVNPS